jgi:hypothetical protein
LRLWRLRKRQQTIDAILQRNENGGIMLKFAMNGQRLTAREYASRREAMAAATERRRELERAGWATHW